MDNSSSLTGASDPNAVARRLVQRAYNRDGLPEIAVGLTFLLISGFIYAAVALRFKLAVLAFALLPLPIFLGSGWALQRLRRRFLIERVGYVEYKPMRWRQIGLGIVFAALLALALFGVETWVSHPDRWLLAGTGLLGGGLIAWCGRLPRFIIGGVVMAATGVFLAFAGVSLAIGFTILYGFQGLVTLVSGGVVFLRLIRQPVETGE
jgi:hypothetical protein